MARLRWSGDDGFDSTGRRVASVSWAFELLPSGQVQNAGPGPALAWPRWYWEAFVAYEGRFDHVRMDGKPGTWAHKHEARAAAELAYETWVRESSSDLASVAGEDGARPAHGEAVDDHNRKVTGVLGNLRSLVRAWRTVYRDDRKKPVPD